MFVLFLFFFNDTATTEIYTLSLHDALPISEAEGSTSTHELWLFPDEWYSAIPAGLPIININAASELFVPGVTDDDIRFGCLAYGVLIKVGP